MYIVRRIRPWSVLALACAALQAGAQGVAPKVLQGAEIAPKLLEMKEVREVPASDFVVDGVKRFDGWFLKADRLIFKKGATLVFSRQALASRRVFFIVAKSIQVEDAAAPGRITWETQAVDGTGPASGQAATGRAPGGAGLPGDGGHEGVPGDSAPSLHLAVLKMPGSGPVIDLQGQAGGPGAQGQRGGSGGPGAAGRHASQNAFNCVRGAENGRPGGAGGPGGRGGTAGRGGNGGTVTILGTPDLLPGLGARVRVLVSGGVAGQPGAGGPGGVGGPGGPGGSQQLPFCRGNGSTGPTGAPGPDGPTGPSDDGSRRGTDGDFFVGPITEAAFRGSIYGGD